MPGVPRRAARRRPDRCIARVPARPGGHLAGRSRLHVAWHRPRRSRPTERPERPPDQILGADRAPVSDPAETRHRGRRRRCGESEPIERTSVAGQPLRTMPAESRRLTADARHSSPRRGGRPSLRRALRHRRPGEPAPEVDETAPVPRCPSNASGPPRCHRGLRRRRRPSLRRSTSNARHRRSGQAGQAREAAHRRGLAAACCRRPAPAPVASTRAAPTAPAVAAPPPRTVAVAASVAQGRAAQARRRVPRRPARRVAVVDRRRRARRRRFPGADRARGQPAVGDEQEPDRHG